MAATVRSSGGRHAIGHLAGPFRVRSACPHGRSRIRWMPSFGLAAPWPAVSSPPSRAPFVYILKCGGQSEKGPKGGSGWPQTGPPRPISNRFRPYAPVGCFHTAYGQPSLTLTKHRFAGISLLAATGSVGDRFDMRNTRAFHICGLEGAFFGHPHHPARSRVSLNGGSSAVIDHSLRNFAPSSTQISPNQSTIV